MEVDAIAPARVWVVRGLAVVAWGVWVAAALAPWYTSARVDSDPDTTTGLGVALIPHVLAIAPLVAGAVLGARRTAIGAWVPMALLVTAVPGLAVGFAIPPIVEASGTDTTVVGKEGAWILVAAVVVATAALLAAARPVRRPGAASSG